MIEAVIKTLTYAPDGEVIAGTYSHPFPRRISVGDYINLNSLSIPLGILRVQDIMFNLIDTQRPTLYLSFDPDTDDETMLDIPEVIVARPYDPQQLDIDVSVLHMGMECCNSLQYKLRSVPEAGDTLDIPEFQDNVSDRCEVVSREWMLADNGRFECTLYVDWDDAEDTESI